MHTTIKQTIILAALLIGVATTTQAADWNLPITVASGVTRTGVVIGMSDKATSGYDNGYDAQNPFTDELISAYFSHPEWNLIKSGKPVSSFYRDVRGAIPQNYILTVKTTLTPLTLSWGSNIIPATLNATISDGSTTADMQKATSFTYSPSGQTTTLTISVTNGDSTPPAVPSNLNFKIKDSSIYLSWDANTEPDLKGYRLHFFGTNGDLQRTLDLKQATNYNMLNVEADVPYSIGVSAYDTTGNESDRSSIISAVRITPPPAPEPEPTPTPTPTPAPVAADGDINGDGLISIVDAIKVLRMALRLDPATAEAASHGDMDGDKSLTIRDALIVLRKSIGL